VVGPIDASRKAVQENTTTLTHFDRLLEHATQMFRNMNRHCDLSTEMIRHDTRLLSEPAHETIQQAVQSGAEIAVRMTEYSAANINTIVKSNADLVEVTRTISRDWMRFAQEGIERGFDWFRCLLQYRALSILPKSRKKPCALVLMPCSGTDSADESVRMADEVTRTTATESTIQRM
jgi:hypothetical protein